MATITFQGKPLHTSGELPKVGSKALDFLLVNSKLEDVSLATFAGKKKGTKYSAKFGYADLRSLGARI